MKWSHADRAAPGDHIRFTATLLGTLLFAQTLNEAAASEFAETCLDVLQWEGDGDVIDRVRATLRFGPLARSSARACRGAIATIAEVRGELSVTLSRNEKHVSRTASSIAVAASWIESWIAPDLTRLPFAVAHTGEPKRKPKPSYRGPRIPVMLSAVAGTDFGSVGPVWPGAELSATLGFAENFWVATAGAATWTPERDGVRRRNLRMTARAGWMHAAGWGALRLGAGVGVFGARARMPANPLFDNSASGPVVEGIALADLDVGDNWSVLLGVLGRAHLSGELGGEDHAGSTATLETVSIWSSSAVVGVSWHNGWTR